MKRPKFRVGQVVRGPYKNDYRKICARQWNPNSMRSRTGHSLAGWEYRLNQDQPFTWYLEHQLDPLTRREIGKRK